MTLCHKDFEEGNSSACNLTGVVIEWPICCSSPWIRSWNRNTNISPNCEIIPTQQQQNIEKKPKSSQDFGLKIKESKLSRNLCEASLKWRTQSVQ